MTKSASEYWKWVREKKKRDRAGDKIKLGELKLHIKRFHPNIPDDIRHELYRRIRSRRWAVPIGRAVGITMDGFVRHEMTEYDWLLKGGVPRAEARAEVAADVKAILAAWSAGGELASPQLGSGVTAADKLSPDGGTGTLRCGVG